MLQMSAGVRDSAFSANETPSFQELTHRQRASLGVKAKAWVGKKGYIQMRRCSSGGSGLYSIAHSNISRHTRISHDLRGILVSSKKYANLPINPTWEKHKSVKGEVTAKVKGHRCSRLIKPPPLQIATTLNDVSHDKGASAFLIYKCNSD